MILLTSKPTENAANSRLASSNVPLRVGVWGLGPHARRNICPALSAMADVKLLGVCTRRSEVLKEAAGKHSCKAWTTPEAMLNDPELDAVFVSTPIGLHHAHGLAVLNAGKHLWMEKPFTRSAADTQELLDLSRKKGRTACEGFMYAYHPQFARLCELAGSPELGRILSITCRFGLPHLDAPGFRNSKELGGSALLDVGCYPVSAVLGLMEGAKFEIRAARVRTPSKGEVDQDGFALLEFESGAIAHLEWGTGRGYKNEIEVWGEHGSVATDRIFSKPESYVAEFTIRDQTGNMSTEVLAPDNAFQAMFSAFARMCGDAGLVEDERTRIRAQAQALDAIAGAGTGAASSD